MFKRYKYIKGLTSLLGSDNSYFIDILGNIEDSQGNSVLVKLDQENHFTVNVKGWDGKRDYRIIDLIAIQFKELEIPRYNYNDVIAFPVDGNKSNHHANNIGYRFSKKIEAVDFPGYYHIPGYTRCAINETGQLCNTKLGKIVNWGITPPDYKKNIKGGYYVYSFRINEKTRTINRHRAMMLTFKDYPDNTDVLVVNHINGIPGNDNLENLEWMTRSENNTHAYVNDLKNQHRRVMCRDVLTGEVIEYYSICECARKMGYSSDETIRNRLVNCEFSKVCEDGKQYKFKDDNRDWVIPVDPVKAIEDAKEYVELIARNCQTMQEITYESMADAFRKTGINDSSIAFRLNRDDRSPLFGYQFKRLTDKRPFPSFTREEYEKSLLPSAFKVCGRNLITKEETEFSSVNTAAKTLGNLNIAYVLRRGEQVLLPNGWQLKFENQEWEKIEDFEEELYKRTKDIMARCEVTGKVIIAESARKLAEVLGKDPKSIRAAALTRGHKVWHGYRFRLGLTTDAWPVE